VIGWLLASGLFHALRRVLRALQQDLRQPAAVIIFFVWLWIFNIAVLFGAEFNAELERGRAMAGGIPADKEPFVELRDTRKLRKKARKRPA
jgi:membrane protein